MTAGGERLGGGPRRRLVAALTMAAGAAILWGVFHSRPFSGRFYALSVLLALVWLGGAIVAAVTRPEAWRRASPDGTSIALGALAGAVLGVVFVVGAHVVRRVPRVVAWLERIFVYMQCGPRLALFVLTLVAGAAEEVFFRGALWSAAGSGAAASPVAARVRGTWQAPPLLVTTVLYALVTLGSGSVLLAATAGVLGLVAGWVRGRTASTAAAVATHVTWSLVMLVALPPFGRC